MRLTEILTPGAIVTTLRSTKRDDVITELLDALVLAGAAKPSLRDELVKLVLERERKGSTGFGKGVAVPHVKHTEAKRVSLAIGLSQTGVDFNSLDKQPVYCVFLLLSPSDNPEAHLKAMEVIFKNLSYDTFRRLLRQAATPEAVRELLEDADSQSLGG